MRSDDTDAMKSSWLPLTGPPVVAGPLDWFVSVPPGAGGNCAGGFFEQAASATMAVAISRGRDNFIGISFARLYIRHVWGVAEADMKLVTLSRRMGSLLIPSAPDFTATTVPRPGPIR